MGRILNSISICLLVWGGSISAQTSNRQTPPDNTGVNERDRNTNQPTADQQKENASDREITRQIRRSITQDKGLSTYAKNIKVITQNGSVTLRGPVRSQEEKKSIESKANEVAGAGHVKSEIQVTAAQSDKNR